MVSDALKGIYEDLTPTSIPFPTVDPQYADLYEAWKKRVQATPVPKGKRFSDAFESASSLFRSAPFALFLVVLGLTVYLLLRRAQARAEELSTRTTERVQGTLVKAERRAAGRGTAVRGTVEYVWWGRTYTGEIALPSVRTPEAGSSVALLIDPVDPGCFRPDEPAPKLLVPKVLSLAAVAAGLALLAILSF